MYILERRKISTLQQSLYHKKDVLCDPLAYKSQEKPWEYIPSSTTPYQYKIYKVEPILLGEQQATTQEVNTPSDYSFITKEEAVLILYSC